MEIELLKVIAGGGGSVVVCVAMVIVFLKHMREVHDSNQQKTETSINKMIENHREESKATREAFQSQIDKMTDRVFEVIDGNAAVVRENAVAVKGLEHAVRELQTKMK